MGVGVHVGADGAASRVGADRPRHHVASWKCRCRPLGRHMQRHGGARRRRSFLRRARPRARLGGCGFAARHRCGSAAFDAGMLRVFCASACWRSHRLADGIRFSRVARYGVLVPKRRGTLLPGTERNATSFLNAILARTSDGGRCFSARPAAPAPPWLRRWRTSSVCSLSPVHFSRVASRCDSSAATAHAAHAS